MKNSFFRVIHALFLLSIFVPVCVVASQVGQEVPTASLVSSIISASGVSDPVEGLECATPLLIEHLKERRTQKALELIDIRQGLNMQDAHGRTPLMWAVLTSNREVLSALISAHASLDIQDNKGVTALMWAVRLDKGEVVKALIKAHASLDIQDNEGKTALMFSCLQGNFEIVKRLLDAGADYTKRGSTGQTALVCAVCVNNEKLVRELLKAGALSDPKDESSIFALRKALENDSVKSIACQLVQSGVLLDEQQRSDLGQDLRARYDIIREMAACLKEQQDGLTPLIRAIDWGYSVADQLMRDNRLDIPDAKNAMTPLMWAIDKGSTPVAMQLIEAGASIDLQDGFGQTALMHAIQKGNKEVALKLIVAGASWDAKAIVAGKAVALLNELKEDLLHKQRDICNAVDYEKDGVTPLIQAILEEYTEVALEYIAAGKWLNEKDTGTGGAPLIWAIKVNIPVVKALIKAGVNVNTQNKDGDTPLICATYGALTDVVAALLKAGAKTNSRDKHGLKPYQIAGQKAKKRPEKRDTYLKIERMIRDAENNSKSRQRKSAVKSNKRKERQRRARQRGRKRNNQENAPQSTELSNGQTSPTQVAGQSTEEPKKTSLKPSETNETSGVLGTQLDFDSQKTPGGTSEKPTCGQSSGVGVAEHAEKGKVAVLEEAVAKSDSSSSNTNEKPPITVQTTGVLLGNFRALVTLLKKTPDVATEAGRSLFVDLIVKAAGSKNSARQYRDILTKILGRTTLLDQLLQALSATSYDDGRSNLFHAIALLDSSDPHWVKLFDTLKRIVVLQDIQTSDTYVVQEVKAALNQPDRRGKRPLELARHEQTRNYLRELGASSDALSSKPSTNIVSEDDEKRDEEDVAFDTAQGSQNVFEHLFKAVRGNQGKTIRSLINRMLAQGAKSEIIRQMKGGNTLLHVAVEMDNLEAVKALTDRFDASVVPKQRTATRKKRKKKAKAAVVDGPTIRLNFSAKNGSGETPLALAQKILQETASDSPEYATREVMVGYLANKTVTATQPVASKSTFMDQPSQFNAAVWAGDVGTVHKLLTQNRALIQTTDPDTGMTALQRAAQANRTGVMALLLAHGAQSEESIRNFTCKIESQDRNVNTDLLVQLHQAFTECIESYTGGSDVWSRLYVHVRDNHFPVALGGNMDQAKSRFDDQLLGTNAPATLMKLVASAKKGMLDNPKMVQHVKGQQLRSDFVSLSNQEVGLHEAWIIPAQAEGIKANVVAAVRNGQMRITTVYPAA